MISEDLVELVKIDTNGNIFMDGVNVTNVLTDIRNSGMFKTLKPDDSELHNLIFKLEYCAAEAEMRNSSLLPEFLNMDGMSTEKVRHYLNNVCTGISFLSGMKHYFEVGCASGSTYISSNFKSNLDSTLVCDIFTEKKCGKSGREDFISNCKEYLGREPENLLTQDCFSLDLNKFSNKINIYLYDGPHEVSDHEKSLTYFEEIFDDTLVFIIDDWNDPRVQLGTLIGLAKINYDVVFWRYDPANFHIAPFVVTTVFRKAIRLDKKDMPPVRGYSLDFGDAHRWTNGLMTMILRKRSSK
jgi:hypothetical protein